MVLALLLLQPIEFRARPPLAEMPRKEAEAFLQDEVQARLVARAEKDGREWRFGPDGTVRIRVEKVEQRNRSRDDLLNDPLGGGSRTKVEVMLEGKRYRGEAKGPFFGSTDRGVLSGSPQAEDLAIRLVNRQRAQAVGDAVYEAARLILNERSESF